MRWIVRAFMAVFGAVVLLGLVVVLANLYDPPLDPGVQAAIDWNPPAVTDAENSYFNHVGLSVIPPGDPHGAGVEIVAQNNARMQQRAQEPRDYAALSRAVLADIESRKAEKSLPWRGDCAPVLCPAPGGNCLSSYSKNRSRIRELAANNPVAMARYRALYRYPHFQERAIENMMLGVPPTPHFKIAARDVALAEIGLKAVDGSGEEALRDLGRDIAYWRRVLAGTHTVVQKVVARAYVDRDYALLSEIAANYRDRNRVIALAQTLMEPLSAEERNWHDAITDEAKRQADLFLHMPPEDTGIADLDSNMQAFDWLTHSLFYKPNATMNLVYKQWAGILSVAAEPADRYRAAAERLGNTLQEAAVIPRLDMVYNPIGKILAAMSAPPADYLRYMSDIHNLEGRMRLIRLQLEIYRRHIAAERIAPYLKESPPALHDPYTNEPMQWDSTRRELWFNGIDRKRKGEGFDLGQRVAVKM
jgi:hypothetical protein